MSLTRAAPEPPASIAGPPTPAHAPSRRRRTAVAAAGLAVLLIVSAHVRSRALGAPFWGDEALSVGIASHPLSAIPHVLREDGSPPLYYLLLHVWMRAFGSSEVATHALSLLFALACVPVGLWLGRTLFGVRAGWGCAVLAALNPLLTAYAQETRMYSLVALLSLLVCGAFVGVFVQRRAWMRPLLALSLAALLYTHGWGAFLAGTAAGAAVLLTLSGEDRRAMARDFVLVFGAAALLFAPWLPTLAFQAAHTGAPWARLPRAHALSRALLEVFAGPGPLFALVVAGAVALWRGRPGDRRAAATLTVLGAGTLLAAWLYSQHVRAWSPRYLTVLLGPLLLAGGLVVARARTAGVAALAVVGIAWFTLPPYDTLARKSNIRTVAARLEHHVRPGDVIVAGQPDTGPLLRYALGPRYVYATAFGRSPDPQVMDWRDAVRRLRAVKARRVLALVRGLRPGQRLAFVRPVTMYGGWHAPWTHLVKLRAAQIAAALERDRALRRVAIVRPGRRGTRSTLRAVVYARR